MKLKPCPFCGGKAHFTDGYPKLLRPSRNGIGVECRECSLVFGWDCDYGGIYENEDAAAEEWNRRTLPKEATP